MSRISFGSLDEVLQRTTHGRALLSSPGPVADAFVQARDPAMLLNGPRGSAKTTTVMRKIVHEATRIHPGPDGVRRYRPGVLRPKYKNLWGTTIPQWWKLFPTEAFPDWTGANGRDADHRIRWRDAFGEVELTVKFRAFSEHSDEDDVRGTEYTDAVLEEWDTFEESLETNIIGSLGRDPPRIVMRRDGRLFGSCNAPDVTSHVYRNFFERAKDGYVLYRQPGGLDEGAENLAIVGREYYLNQLRLNAHRPWWVKKMVHNRPGFSRAADPILPDFDDVTMVSPVPLEILTDLPVVIGFDGGATPAAAFCQFTLSPQMRIAAEVALERGDEYELAQACKLIMGQPRFEGAEFVGVCDPAMNAGDDLPGKSMRARLAAELGIRIVCSDTNDPEERHKNLRPFTRANRVGAPGMLLDPSCLTLRRGFMQTFQYRRIHGTNDRSGVEKNPDSHVCEAAEYAACRSGDALATRRRSTLQAERQAKRQAAGGKNGPPRYSPLRRRA